jgi:hypothetical protein
MRWREHRRAVILQMFNELDRAPLLGPAEQLGKPPLALDQWQLAQVVALVLQQVEGVQRHLTAPSEYVEPVASYVR